MSKTTGIVEGGMVRLPEHVKLPEGARVDVVWDDAVLKYGPPLEREPWTEEDVRHEIEWARSWKWQK
jgi:hypothetical protein